MQTGAVSPRLSGLLERVARGEELSPGERDELACDAEANPALQALNSAGWPVTAAVEERMGLLRRAARFSPVCPLEVAGYSIEARTSIGELWRVYVPLCSALLDRCARQQGSRFLVGIAGPPGSGKSVFAALLTTLLNCIGEHPSEVAVTVPLDGFHFPNAYLDTHYVVGADGERRSLRKIKGAPGTFDLAGFLRALERLHSDERVTLPRYDRRLHEPVENGIAVEPHHRLVLVEGNYLLVQAGGWQAVQALLNLRLFLKMALSAVRPGMVERHVRGGRTREDAERHFDRVDLPNYGISMQSAAMADLVIER